MIFRFFMNDEKTNTIESYYQWFLLFPYATPNGQTCWGFFFNRLWWDKKKLFGALEWSRFSIVMSNAPNGTNIAKQLNILKIIRFTWVIRNDVSKKFIVFKKIASQHKIRSFVIYIHIYSNLFFWTPIILKFTILYFHLQKIRGSGFLVKRKRSLMKMLIKTAPSILWLSSFFLQFSTTLIKAITYRNITCRF